MSIFSAPRHSNARKKRLPFRLSQDTESENELGFPSDHLEQQKKPTTLRKAGDEDDDGAGDVGNGRRSESEDEEEESDDDDDDDVAAPPVEGEIAEPNHLHSTRMMTHWRGNRDGMARWAQWPILFE